MNSSISKSVATLQKISASQQVANSTHYVLSIDIFILSEVIGIGVTTSCESLEKMRQSMQNMSELHTDFTDPDLAVNNCYNITMPAAVSQGFQMKTKVCICDTDL